MSKITDDKLGHAADNDGIEEYDNPLPDWWLAMFYLCIIWAALYAVDYHFYSQRSQAATYDAEVADAALRWPALTQAASFDDSPENLAAGEAVYNSTCVTCHGADLDGGIGVSLVDNEWKHGGSYDAIVAVVTDGVPAAGMPAWGGTLGPQKVGQVAAYILSKRPE